MDQFFSKYSYGKINVNWSSWPRNAEGNVVSYTAPQAVRRYLPWSQNNMKGYSPSEGLDRFRELFNGAVEAARPQIEQAFTKGEIDVDGDNWIDSLASIVEYPRDANSPNPSDILYPKRAAGLTAQIHG